MVSWGRAFFLALKAFIYAILWYIIGGILIFSGMYLAGLSFPFSPTGFGSVPNLSFSVTSILGIILMIIGMIIIIFGATASLIKVAVDEIEKRRPSYQPPPPPY